MEKTTRRAIALIVVITLIKLVVAEAFEPDPALVDVHRLDIVPYGILWQWTNPLYWTWNYPQIMVLLDIPVTIFNGLYLSRRWFWAWTITDFHWFMGFFSNVTVTWFAPYPVIGPVWTILQKLPIGYSWNLSDGHVNCAFWCSGISGEIAKGYIWRWAGIVTYTIILLWTVVPTAIWLRNRRKQAKPNLQLKPQASSRASFS